jgi:alpha-tubulin suppressor-like RCC1 family protein
VRTRIVLVLAACSAVLASAPAPALSDRVDITGPYDTGSGSRNSPAPMLLGNVAKAAGGYVHTLAIKSDGTLWACGGNSRGELGDGTTTDRRTPVQVSGLRGVVAAAAGGLDTSSHSLAVTSDGTVWAWGDNSYGELGDGTTTDHLSPVQVPSLTGVASVATGAHFSLALKSDGTVWAWGDNHWGTLGDGTQTQRLSPVRVTGLTGIVAVAAGESHALAVNSDGTVWAWGTNSNGELGNGSTAAAYLAPVQALGLTNVIAVAGGSSFSLAVRSDGTVWSWGYNNYGQLGDTVWPSRNTPAQVSGADAVVAVAAGSATSLALKSDGTVLAWGYGAADDETNAYSPVPVPGLATATSLAVGWWHRLAVESDGTLWGWGSNGSGQLGDAIVREQAPTQVSGLAGVTATAAGGGFSFARKSDGTLWSWGANNYSVLGDGTNISRSTPGQVSNLTAVTQVAASVDHTMAVQADGTVWVWGHGATGAPQHQVDSAVPVQVTDLADVVSIATEGQYGRRHSLALKTDGTVWAWGWNRAGELGDGTTTDHPTPIQVPALSEIVSVAAGFYYSLAVQADGTVWAWGDNHYGQLGDGTTTGRESPVPVPGLPAIRTVSAFGNHSLAVASDGTLWAWGYNYHGQLGDGTTTQRNSPVQVPGLSGVISAAAGEDHSVAVLSDGSAWAWGSNDYLQLGELIGYPYARYTPARVIGPTGVTSASAGSHHSLFVAEPRPVAVAGTWPANGAAERPVHCILVSFDWPVTNVSADDLTLSSGSVVGVQGSGCGPYIFTVAGLPNGAVTATLDGDITDTDGTDLPAHQWTFRTTPLGDVDGDGDVDVIDLLSLAAAWSADTGDATYDARCDLNADGSVDVIDLLILAGDWGT